MIFLTEEEFDRKYLIKLALARSFLRLAAEIDDTRNGRGAATSSLPRSTNWPSTFSR